jgi:hypothetical protein
MEPFTFFFPNDTSTLNLVMAPFELSRSLLGGITGAVVDGLQECPTADCQLDDVSTFGLCTSCRNIPNETRQEVGLISIGQIWRAFTFEDPFYSNLNMTVPLDAEIAANGLLCT